MADDAKESLTTNNDLEQDNQQPFSLSATAKNHSNAESDIVDCDQQISEEQIDFGKVDETDNQCISQSEEILSEYQKNTFSSLNSEINEANVSTVKNGSLSQYLESTSEDGNLHGLALHKKLQDKNGESTTNQDISENTYNGTSEESNNVAKHTKNISNKLQSTVSHQDKTSISVEDGISLTENQIVSTNVQSLSHKINEQSSEEKSAQLNLQMQDLMHKNLEKFSPEKKSKPLNQKKDVQFIENSNMAKSDLPQRVNPFNHNGDNESDIGSDVWTMRNSSSPTSSKTPQSLSLQYQDNLHTNDYEYSHSNDIQPREEQRSNNQCTQGLNENVTPTFELMPTSYRVCPIENNLTSSEDIDAVVKQAKSKNLHTASDPWVKIEPAQNISSKNHPDSHEKNDHYLAAKEKEVKTPSSPSTSLVRPLIEAAGPFDPAELIDGIVFATYYLGSTQLQSEKNPGKSARMMQAQEAVSRIKAPEGESQPSVEVDLLISTDKVKILNADTQETIMDHTLRSISYIADIGKLLVIMAKRRSPPSDNQEQEQILRDPKPQRSYRIICHVFSSPDAQLMAQAIGQSFNVAYQQFLSANGIEPQTLTRDDYNQLLDMQEMYHDDLVHYSKQENVKDVWVEKNKGELLGVVIVESGWGSIVPTVILANLQHGGPAERCGKLSIGDQLMTINGTSLVGLPLTTCQSIIKGLRSQTIARLHIVSCPPVVTVLIKRPDLKYQLGFSVQDGIICSLMRGGIAERGGVRVGHRIIEINGHSVVATSHEKIVQMLVSSIGEIQMKTMPAMMYRLLTGQEQPVYI